jgi:ABC-type transporter Mla subunit MlaD
MSIDGEITVNALVQGDTAGAEQLIARVLGRAHRTAEALEEPDEARAILRLAHAFADELAGTDPRFDRAAFIHTATGHAS